jgi:integrase
MARKASGTIEYRPGRDDKPGRWFGRITCVDGSRPWLDLGGWPNSPQGRERAKEAAAAATERARELGLVATPRGSKASTVPADAQTTSEFVSRWLADRERRGLSSIGTDRGRLKLHVEPVIGALPVRKVGRDDVRAVVERLDTAVREGRLAWRTGVRVWGLVTKMFSDACESKVAALRVRTDNPCDGVRGPDRGAGASKQWLFPSEIRALLGCAEVPLRWRRLYALASYLYLRPGELAALEWGDVDLARGHIVVRRALDLRTGEAKGIKTSKEGVVKRTVPVPDALVPLLALLSGECGGSGRVVQHTADNKSIAHGLPPLEDLAATLRTHLGRASVTRAELFATEQGSKRVTFYDLRHTGITWEVLAGTDHVRIMQRAGHRSFSTTQGYVHDVGDVRLGNDESPFPALPASLVQSSGESSALDDSIHDRASKKLKKTASPTGFEPVLQP